MSAKRPPRLDLNPSSAERWTTCTASPQFILDNWDKLPPQDNKFSVEGTTAHEVASAELENRKPNPKECPTPIDGDMRWHAWNYAEYVNDLRSPDDHLMVVEKKFPLWYMPQRNAKIDVAIFNPDSLHVVDYKYGEGIIVSPENNLQGAIYVRAVVSQVAPETAPEFPVFVHIYQPRSRNAAESPFHVWETTWGEIKAFTDKHVTGNADDILHGNLLPEFQPRFAPSDKACQWCPAKGFCNARQQQFASDFEQLAVIDEQPKTLPLAQAMSVKQLAAILQHGDAIVKWVNDAKDYALSHMKAGGTLPGYKLVLSRGGNRYWSDPVKAAKAMLKDTLLREDEVYEKKVIGPAAVEKLIGKNKMPKELYNLVAKPPGQPVIAPMDDKREPCLIDARNEFAEMADPLLTVEDF